MNVPSEVLFFVVEKMEHHTAESEGGHGHNKYSSVKQTGQRRLVVKSEILGFPVKKRVGLVQRLGKSKTIQMFDCVFQEE